MNHRKEWLAFGLIAGMASAALAQPPAAQEQYAEVLAVAARARAATRPPVEAPIRLWNGRRTADGQPDVTGFYGPDKQGTYSLTFPSNGGTGEVVRNVLLGESGIGTPEWPSRVIDPPDGEIPFQSWARAKQLYVQANIDWPTEQAHLDPQGRCFPDGVVRNPLWTGFQIRQFPGHVVVTFDQNHTYRIIPLDGRPHVDERIKLWMSDSRGRWDGNTLIVDVRNSNAKHRLSNIGEFTSDNVHIVEYFTFSEDGSGYEYRAVFDDPTVFTRPWTLWAQYNRSNADDPQYEQWEQACHEGEKNALASLLTPEQARATRERAESAASAARADAMAAAKKSADASAEP